MAAGLFAFALLTRVPFLTDNLWAHDSVLYARAIERFDPAAHQPQPPGYLWYVLLVRAVAAVVGDANRAMTIVSAVAAAAAVALLYVVAARMYGERPGRIAALFLLTSVTFWAESGVAYPYTLLAALTILVFLLLWWADEAAAARRPTAQGIRLTIASGALGLAAGARPDLALFLGPLWLLIALRARPPWILGAIASGAAAGALWLLANAAVTPGGLAAFAGALEEQSAFVRDRYSVAGEGLDALARNTRDVARFVGRALYAIAPLLLVLAGTVALERRKPERRTLAVALWALAPLPVYVLVHIGEYGYAFTMLPGLCVLAALGAVAAAERIRVRAALPAIVAATVVVNSAIFLLTDTPMSAADVARRDQGTAEKVAYIRANADPGRSVITSAYDTVIVEHYLGAQYTIVGFDPDRRGGAYLRIACRSSCSQARAIIWDDALRPAGSRWRTVTLASGATLRIADVVHGSGMRTRGLAIQLDGQ